MVLSQLKKFQKNEPVLRFNLWLTVGFCPSACCIGKTVLISKDQNDISQPKHWPITKCFHKLMAHRMGDSMSLSDRQKAFCSGDGLAENVVLLKSIIKHHTDNNLALMLSSLILRRLLTRCLTRVF